MHTNTPKLNKKKSDKNKNIICIVANNTVVCEFTSKCGLMQMLIARNKFRAVKTKKNFRNKFISRSAVWHLKFAVAIFYCLVCYRNSFKFLKILCFFSFFQFISRFLILLSVINVLMKWSKQIVFDYNSLIHLIGQDNGHAFAINCLAKKHARQLDVRLLQRMY